MPEELAMAIVELKRDEVLDAVKNRAGKGEDPLQILEECRSLQELRKQPLKSASNWCHMTL